MTAETVSEKPVADPTTEDDVNWNGILIGYGLGALAWIACFVIAARFPPEQPQLNLLICVFGSIVGWSAGMLLTPSRGELEEFRNFRRAISALLSGFALAKVESLLQSPSGPNFTNIGRILLFSATFLLCLQFTYVARKYKPKEPGAQPKQRDVTPLRSWERWLRLGGIALVLIVAGGFVYLNVLRDASPAELWLTAGAAAGVIALVASIARVREALFGGSA